MWTQLGMTGGFICLLGAVLWMACKEGSKAAKLEALKAEIKKQAQEQARAQKIFSSVEQLHAADVRRRLRNLSSK